MHELSVIKWDSVLPPRMNKFVHVCDTSLVIKIAAIFIPRKHNFNHIFHMSSNFSLRYSASSQMLGRLYTLTHNPYSICCSCLGLVLKSDLRKQCMCWRESLNWLREWNENATDWWHPKSSLNNEWQYILYLVQLYSYILFSSLVLFVFREHI